MDGQRFDTLARRWAATRTRRHVLQALAGGVLAGAVGLRGGAPAGAKTCRELRQRCSGKDQCCGPKTVCRRPSTDADGARRCCHLDGGRCQGGADCCTGFACNAVTFRCDKFP
jgi:hypothetical protein